MLVAEGFVFATGEQRATDALLLAGVALVTVAVAVLHVAQRSGKVASVFASAVVIGGLFQVAAVASGLLNAAELGWVHGIGFLIMGLGLIGYGVVALRSGVIGPSVPLIFIALPILPLPLGELINAAWEVEGTTIVSGILWIAVAALLPRSSGNNRIQRDSTPGHTSPD
jgi:hypothetical protein